jgi:hypothetical protein
MHHAELTSRGLFHAIEFQNLPVDYIPHVDILLASSHTLSRCIDNEMKVVVGEKVRFNPPGLANGLTFYSSHSGVMRNTYPGFGFFSSTDHNSKF